MADASDIQQTEVPEKYIPKRNRATEPIEQTEIERALADATLPAAPKLNGSQELVDQVCTALDAAHQIGISDIDTMILRLQNVKAAIEIKKAASQESIKDFIGSIGQSLHTLQDLERLIKGIEEKHL